MQCNYAGCEEEGEREFVRENGEAVMLCAEHHADAVRLKALSK